MTIKNVKIRNISHMLFVSVMPSIESASALLRLSVGRVRQFKADFTSWPGRRNLKVCKIWEKQKAESPC